MSEYLKAYGERIKRNHDALINLIHEVEKADPTVEAYIHKEKDRLISNVVFFKDDKINSIWFHDVPYRWSGCGYGEHYRSHPGGENVAMPFTAEDVISTFQPIQKNTYMKSATKEAYLKWYSYLTKYNPNDKNEND